MKVCWICFNSDEESQSKFVAPCKCSGDTKWGHESCLLTWIHRQQQQLKEEGQFVPLLIQYSNHELGNEQSPFTFQKEEGDYIKCPQCHEPYRILLKKPSFPIRLFFSSVHLVNRFTDFSIPYFTILGTSYVVVLSSVAYGIYAVSLVCGLEDELLVTLRTEHWKPLHWLTLFATPYVLLILKTPIMERTLASFSFISLSWWTYERRVLHLPFWPSQSSAQKSLVLLGLFGLKRIYNVFYWKLLKPWFLNIKTDINKSPDTKLPLLDASESEEQEEPLPLDEENDEEGQQIAISLTNIFKTLVSAWTLPQVSYFSGLFLQYNLSKYFKNAGMNRFLWTVLGGCVFIGCKDLCTLAYWRQKKYMRAKMHVASKE